jgi:hypothetical protein
MMKMMFGCRDLATAAAAGVAHHAAATAAITRGNRQEAAWRFARLVAPGTIEAKPSFN